MFWTLYFVLLWPWTSCHSCVDVVGSLNHDNLTVTQTDVTFILGDSDVMCEGVVYGWEFCFKTDAGPPVTFYPSIWKVTRRNGPNTNYELVNMSTITFSPNSVGIISCLLYELNTSDWFTIPNDSAVGLYIESGATVLLRSNRNTPISTFKYDGHIELARNAGQDDTVNFNIAVRVLLKQTSSQHTVMTSPVLVISTLTLTSTHNVVMTSTFHINTNVGQYSTDDHSLNVGVFSGIVAGCVVIVIVIGTVSCLLAVLIWYKRRKLPVCTEVRVSTSGRWNDLCDNEMPDDTTSQSLNIDPYKSFIDTTYTDIDIDDVQLEPADYEQPESTLRIINSHSVGYAKETFCSDEKVDDTIITDDDELLYEDPGHQENDLFCRINNIQNIHYNHLSGFHVIGSGEFGVVHLGTWADGSADPIPVAVKTLNSKCSESDRVKFLREAAIMGQFQHNNIVQLHGVVTEEENMMIVLEYMAKGDLRSGFLLLLKRDISAPRLHESRHDFLSYCRQISSGLNYLASKHFVHRDLAARNILVSSDDVCKIADFGMARDANETLEDISGEKIPIKWMPPEAILYKKYSTKSDVWSFGCVMYELWSLGQLPFHEYDSKAYIEKITTGYRLPPPPGCPRAIYELMIQCWHPKPQHRPLPVSLLRILQKSDRVLLQQTEQTLELGAISNSTECDYSDLQFMYIQQ